MKKTVTHLADGRELIYFDSGDAEALAAHPDKRPLDPVLTNGETRYDPVLGRVGRDRRAPAGPDLPPAGRPVPAVPQY